MPALDFIALLWPWSGITTPDFRSRIVDAKQTSSALLTIAGALEGSGQCGIIAL